MKIKDLEDRLAKSENANDELKSANARLESQVSILKEGSDAIISQHQAGGAAREAQEAEWRATIRDLKSKLESSSERSMELEKKNRDLEHQLASAAKSITEQVATAVQKATSEVSAELTKLRIESEDKIETLQTDLEMATVDKEIAEEERDTAVKEMEQLKLQNEMLEAFKQAAEETASKKSQVITSHAAPTSSGEGSGAEFDVTSSEEYISLHAQHERLKEALVKLKDMAVEEKQSHERTSRELEQLNLRTIPALEDKILKLSEQNVDYEEQVEILKANIDDAAELQEKYTDLFERKLDLEEENRKLKNDITEMEALRDLSEQLEEEQAANEARLKAELYEKQIEVLDREAALKNAKDQIASQGVLVDRLQGLLSEQRTATSLLEKKLSNALSKSRKRRGRRVPIDLDENVDVTSGNSEDQDLEDYEDEEVDDEMDDANEDSHGLSHSSSTASLRSLQQKESELQVILQKQAAKAAIQSLASKLGDLERKQAIEQFALYQAFVPENYIRVDSEAIKSLLLSKRLREKSSIVVQYLREQFHLERFERSAVVQEDVASITPLTTTEELAYFAWNLAALITRLGNNAAVFAESFKSADQESYMRFARLHSEMAPMEKKMDHLISLLQQEELTASYSLADFETLLEGFDPLVSQHCQFTSLPANQHYMRLGSELVFASRSCFFEVVALKSTVNQTATTSGVSPAPLLSTIDLISQTIVKYLVDGSRKLRRAAESRPALTYVGNTLSQLRAALHLSRTLQGFFRGLRQKVEAAGDRLEETMLAEITESMVKVVDPQIEEILQALPSADDTTQGRLTKKYDASVTCVLKLLFSLDEDIARGAHDGGIAQIAPSASSSDLSSISSSSGLVTKSPVPAERVIDGVTISNVLQLQARASVLLEEVAAAAGLKGELSSLQKELRDRESALGFKSKEIEDLEWRLRKQEHRLQTLEKVEIEAKEELASHQKNYASQVMNLETANRELTEKIEQLTIDCEEAKTSSQAHAARAVSLEEQLTTTIQTQQQSISLDSATTQISSLRAAVGQLRSEVSRHRTKEARISLQTKLPPLAIPSISTSITATNTLSSENMEVSASSRLRQISGHADKLVDSAYSLSTMPCIVDLTRSDITPGQQLESLQFQEVRIKASLFEACRDTVKILSETEQASAPSHFSSFPTTAFVANVNSTARGPITVGKVTIPTSRKRDSEFAAARRRPVPTPVPVTPADLVSIHSLLAQ
jgi:DNA repair exonuclease SbcCD ATPase subunit